jgi:hypothetical protein
MLEIVAWTSLDFGERRVGDLRELSGLPAAFFFMNALMRGAISVRKRVPLKTP